LEWVRSSDIGLPRAVGERYPFALTDIAGAGRGALPIFRQHLATRLARPRPVKDM
jgi:hypothetical protein